jgi:vitamin B12 transporter
MPNTLKFKTSYGTGYKAPSLYQLYSSYGNLNLQPSQSASQDMGFEVYKTLFGGDFTFEINGFRNRFHNNIDYSFSTNKYANIAESLSEGFEFIFSWTKDAFKIENTLTSLHSNNLLTGTALPQIPSQIYNLDLHYGKGDENQILLNWRFVSARDDFNSSGAGVIMPSYSVVNVHGQTLLAKDLHLIGHIDNLFDQVYESVSGYGTARLSLYLGVKAEL